MKATFAILIMLLTVKAPLAEDFTTTGYAFYKAGLTPMAPYTFIFNRSGEIVYLNKGLDLTFARAIKQNKIVAESEDVKRNLEKLISLPDFTASDFTLITTKIAGECLPCNKQLDAFDEVLPKLAPLTFSRITITLDPNQP